MIELLQDERVLWALAIVIVLPIAIISVGEIEERLRQRDSVLTSVVSIIRQWSIPLFAIWALIVGLFELDRSNIVVRLVGSLLLFSLLAVVLRSIRLVIVWWMSRPKDGERRRIPQLLLALPRVAALLAAGWILLAGVWGVDLTAALTALGVTSLVVSFALQDTLSGLASGFLLLADAPFAPGDWIRAGEMEGRVLDINWRSSRIETRNGDLLVVPNAFLAGATVTNYDEPSRLHRVVVPVQVAFSNPPTLAKEMLLDAALSTEHVLADPAPNVRVVQIDDPLMGYEVDLWIDDYRLAPKVSSDFGSLVWYQSHRHEVPLPSPAYDIFMHDTTPMPPDPARAVERLRCSPLLEQLPAEDLDRLASSSRVLRFQRGEIIIDLSGRRREMCLLWQGSAVIAITVGEGKDVEVGALESGDLFGLMASTEDWVRQPVIKAREDCEVVVIPEQDAAEVTSRNNDLSTALNQIVSTRVRRVDRVLRQLAESELSGDETRAADL